MGIANALKRIIPSVPGIQTISLPLPEEARWMTERVRYTPDMGYLELSEFQLLFVPDVLRTGYVHYDKTEGVLLCGGYTEKNFAHWYQQVGDERIGIPMRQDVDSPLRYMPPALKIKGELQAVLSSRFDVVDTHMRNTHLFRRQRMNILVPYRKRTKNTDDLGNELPKALQGKDHIVDGPKRVYIIRAWMYVGIPEYWNDLLDAGFRGFKTVNHYESRFNPWLKRYYDFPKHPLE